MGQGHDIHFAKCLEAAVRRLDWEHSPHLPRSEGPLRRGCGLAVMIKSTPATSKSECWLVLNQEGLITIYTSTTEMGQGAHTALAQIAAGELGVPVHKLRVVGPDTLVTPFDSMTTSSRSTEMMGSAVRRAAGLLKQKLKQAAIQIFEREEQDLSVGEGEISVSDQPELRLTYADIFLRSSYLVRF